MVINQKTNWKFVVRICINGLSKCLHNIGIRSDIWYAMQDHFLLCLYPPECDVIFWTDLIWARFLSLVWSKLRLCSANHRPGYWSNLSCDWLSTAWAYSKQETENGPWYPRPFSDFTCDTTISPPHPSPMATYTHTVDLFICADNFLWHEIYTSSFSVLILVIPP